MTSPAAAARRPRCSATRSTCRARRRRTTACPPSLGEHTDELPAEAGLGEATVRALHEAGAVAGRSTRAEGSFLR